MTDRANLPRDYDPRKTNHFYHDGEGDPATCLRGDHNHPEPERSGRKTWRVVLAAVLVSPLVVALIGAVVIFFSLIAR